MATEDVLAEHLRVELLGLNVVTREAVLGVGNIETTVRGPLHRTKDAGTCRRASEADIQEDFKWAALLAVDLDSLGERELAISLLNASKVLIKLQLLQCATGEEKTGGVRCSPVGETVGDSVGLQLVGICSTLVPLAGVKIKVRSGVFGSPEYLVAADLGGHNLSDDVAVGEADDKPILWSVVLVLGLGDQPLARIYHGQSELAVAIFKRRTVVGLALAPPLVLDLVSPGAVSFQSQLEGAKVFECSREIRIVLDELGYRGSESAIIASIPSRSSLPTPTQLTVGWGA